MKLFTYLKGTIEESWFANPSYFFLQLQVCLRTLNVSVQVSLLFQIWPHSVNPFSFLLLNFTVSANIN